jgi:hypothetical protein
MVDTEVYASSYKFYSFELSPIICEDPLGYAEPIYDTFQELDYCILGDIHDWHGFLPLGECVSSDK